MKKILVFGVALMSLMGIQTTTSAQGIKKKDVHSLQVRKVETAKDFKTSKQVNQEENSLLWRISGNGLVYPSYLFGTIHIICKEDFIWTAAMERSLKDCKRVCYEMNITDPALQMKVGMGMLNTGGTPLKELLGDDYYKKLEAYAAKHISNIPFSSLAMLKPMAISTILSTSTLDCKEQTGYELEIKSKVSEEVGKNILGLETAEDQIAIFNSVPEDQMAKQIKDFLDNGGDEKAKQQFELMLKYYQQQDLNNISQMMNAEENSYIDQSVFLNNRNKNWVEKMGSMMHENPTFFAVGAAHLPGENGVINLLRQLGYTVVPILE